jgi:hypothetical protein
MSLFSFLFIESGAGLLYLNLLLSLSLFHIVDYVLSESSFLIELNYIPFVFW